MKKVLIILLVLFTTLTLFAFDTHPCRGKTKDGNNCSRKVSIGNYCFQHNPNAKKCGATTKTGSTCQRVVKQGKCSLH